MPGRVAAATAAQGVASGTPGIQVTQMLLSYGLCSWQRQHTDEYGATWSSPPSQLRPRLNSGW